MLNLRDLRLPAEAPRAIGAQAGDLRETSYPLMWQRIQSVFLGLAILSLVLGLLSPVWSGAGEGIEYRLYPIYFMAKQNGQITISQYFPFSVTAMLMAAA